MEIVLAKILQQLELLTITGRDAERMVAIKSMVRELKEAVKAAKPTQEGEG
jgi:hypothetical protein